MAMTELCKHVRQIRRHTTLHMRRAIHAVLVLAKIIPFAPMRVRKHCVGLGNQLELFLIAALRATKKKKRSHTHHYKYIQQKRGPYLVWMMFERFTSIRLFNVRLIAISRDAKDLVIIFRLAPLKRSLSTLQFATQRAHVAVRALELGLLERGAEIRYRIVVLFLVDPDARPRA